MDGRFLRVAVLCLLLVLASSGLSAAQSCESVVRVHDSISSCVREAGFNSDGVIYAYSKGHGAKWISSVKSTERKTGIPFSEVDLGVPKDNEPALMECFISDYSSREREFSTIPHMLCPKTGLVKPIYSDTPVWLQMRVFAEECII